MGPWINWAWQQATQTRLGIGITATVVAALILALLGVIWRRGGTWLAAAAKFLALVVQIVALGFIACLQWPVRLVRRLLSRRRSEPVARTATGGAESAGANRSGPPTAEARRILWMMARDYDMLGPGLGYPLVSLQQCVGGGFVRTEHALELLYNSGYVRRDRMSGQWTLTPSGRDLAAQAGLLDLDAPP